MYCMFEIDRVGTIHGNSDVVVNHNVEQLRYFLFYIVCFICDIVEKMWIFNFIFKWYWLDCSNSFQFIISNSEY